MSQRRARSIRTRGILAVIVAVVAALVPAGTAQGSEGGPELTVLTRNVYLGTGLDNTVFAATIPMVVQAVSTDWANVLATDFPTPARALADEIVGAQADVVGLQEATLWRTRRRATSPSTRRRTRRTWSSTSWRSCRRSWPPAAAPTPR